MADELEEDAETIQPLYEIVIKYAPAYNEDEIMEEALRSKDWLLWQSFLFLLWYLAKMEISTDIEQPEYVQNVLEKQDGTYDVTR